MPKLECRSWNENKGGADGTVQRVTSVPDCGSTTLLTDSTGPADRRSNHKVLPCQSSTLWKISKVIARHAQSQVGELLTLFPAVALLGPRQVGKTTLSHEIAEATGTQALYLDLGSRDRPRARTAAEATLGHRDQAILGPHFGPRVLYRLRRREGHPPAGRPHRRRVVRPGRRRRSRHARRRRQSAGERVIRSARLREHLPHPTAGSVATSGRDFHFRARTDPRSGAGTWDRRAWSREIQKL